MACILYIFFIIFITGIHLSAFFFCPILFIHLSLKSLYLLLLLSTYIKQYGAQVTIKIITSLNAGDFFSNYAQNKSFLMNSSHSQTINMSYFPKRVSTMGKSTYFYRRQSLLSLKHTTYSTNAYCSCENTDCNSQPAAAGLILTVESLGQRVDHTR